MKKLPENVKPYKRTPVFTHETVPQALLKNHATGEGVWGMLQVKEGELEYTIEDKETHTLKPGYAGIIEPQIFHHVKPLGDVAFFINFLDNGLSRSIGR